MSSLANVGWGFSKRDLGNVAEVVGWAGDGFENAPFPDGVEAPGLEPSFLFGLTSGSAGFGRRIPIGGAPFGPVEV